MQILIAEWNAAAGFIAKFWFIIRLATGAMQATPGAVASGARRCYTWAQLAAVGQLQTITDPDIGTSDFNDVNESPWSARTDMSSIPSDAGICDQV